MLISILSDVGPHLTGKSSRYPSAFEELNGAVAVVRVAIVIAVGEVRPDLPQVA
jgi:hypothetical protein